MPIRDAQIKSLQASRISRGRGAADVRSSFPGCDFLCLRAGFELVDAESVGSLAACIVEPIISAGGLIDPPRGYLSALRAECRKRGMIYILDEAQTAFGRLGTMFAFEQDGGPPDILTLSKTFGGGIPIAAAVTSPEIEGAKITRECPSRGLLVSIVQFPGSLSVWRIAPPLTTTRAEIDRALGIIDSSIRAVVGG